MEEDIGQQRMKRSHFTAGSPGADGLKIKITQSEVQTLIEKEVRSAVKNNDSKLQSLIKAYEQLDDVVNYEQSIQKLQAQINTVSKRAEAALAHMTKKRKKRSPSSLDSSDSEDEAMNATSQIDKKSMDCVAKNGELFQMMETAKNAVKTMHAQYDAAVAVLNEERPPVPGSAECKELVNFIKNEPKDGQKKGNTSKELKQIEEPELKEKKECFSPDDSNRHAKQDWLLIPPLPPTTFPSILSIEAASYSMPPSLEVSLVFIRNPPRLSVLWKLAEEDPAAPPMDSYTIYLTMEKVKGSGVFPDWKVYDRVLASPLPMYVLTKKYKPGHKVCAAVVGRDVYGRYGPYSTVATKTIPE